MPTSGVMKYVPPMPKFKPNTRSVTFRVLTLPIATVVNGASPSLNSMPDTRSWLTWITLGPAEILALAVEVLFFLQKALFDLLRLRPVLPGFLFGGGADLDRFLFGLQQLLFGLRVRV